MLDILDIFSGDNLLMPFVSFFQDWTPHTKFGVAALEKHEVRCIIERAGINAWGFQNDIENSTIIFSVKKDHTRWAYNELKEAGKTIVYPVLED